MFAGSKRRSSFISSNRALSMYWKKVTLLVCPKASVSYRKTCRLIEWGYLETLRFIGIAPAGYFETLPPIGIITLIPF
jgi:hypothetical protein